MSYETTLAAEKQDLADLQAERDAIAATMPDQSPALCTSDWDQYQIDHAKLVRLDLYIRNAEWSISVLETKIQSAKQTGASK